MQRVLITGGSGLLALNWACRMRDDCEIILARHTRKVALRRTRSVSLSLEQVATLIRDLEQLKPDLVVHTVGLTSVDQCEQQPELASHVNAALAENVARATHALGIGLVHISTDHLFSGARALYKENDQPSPLNVYASSKLQAEELVAQANPNAIIVRTNFFGWGHRYRQSFSDWIIAGLRGERQLAMYDDAFFTPVLADRLATAAHALAQRGATGIFHVGGDERLSKYDFALRTARVFGLPAGLVQRAKMADAKTGVARPLDMSLDNHKLRAMLGSGCGGTDEHLQQLAAQERDGRARELMDAVTE